VNRCIIALALLVPALVDVGCSPQRRRGSLGANSARPMDSPPSPAGLSAGGNVNLASATRPAAPGSVAITPQNAKIEFIGSGHGKSHGGSFKQFTGVFDAPNNDLSASRLALEIDMNSITTDIFILTKHLKGGDFFDVKNHPAASFVSTSIRPAPSANGTHALAGTFTIHGVARAVEVPARINLTGDQLTLDCTFVVKQSEFGMTEGLKKTDDEVPVTVTVRAARSR